MAATALVTELLPAPDPWEAFQKLRRFDGLLFLDSALRHGDLGRYSFLTADPFASIEVAAPGSGERTSVDPFDELRQALETYRTPTLPGMPPFQGGAAGLFAYDLGGYLEQLPGPPRGTGNCPAMAVGLHDWVLAFDHSTNRAWLVSQGFPEIDEVPRRSRARERSQHILDILEGEAPEVTDVRGGPVDEALPPGCHPVEAYPGLFSPFTRDRYIETIQKAIEYIYAGEIFQVNLSQPLYFRQQSSVVEIYRSLRERNPTTFAAYYEPSGMDFALLSASPERFLSVSPRGLVETRPIKGTRPRKRFAEEDCFVRDELRESAKDRAENVMIVDLLRNDLSRVSKPGSVEVPQLFGVETYPSIHHLVSVVRGELAEDQTALDLLRAAFPGGSITGAPKIRAMEIIAELESRARGAYCGSLGYLGFDGSMDTSILIRTITASRGWLEFPAGGGIVAHSEPEREYQETLDKARGIYWALTQATTSE